MELVAPVIGSVDDDQFVSVDAAAGRRLGGGFGNQREGEVGAGIGGGSHEALSRSGRPDTLILND